MPLTYKEFKTKLRRTIWVAPGEPANLVAAHNIFFNEAMIELAKWCLLLRQNNTSVISACSTLVRCGLTVLDLPTTVEGPGVIKRVYTIANDEWCDYVWYEKAEFSKVQCWSRNLLCGFTSPTNAGLPALQQGFKYASAESDSTYGRGRIGMWATDRKRLYIAPWIQSNEKVVVEWDGWKQDWQDDDLVDEILWGADTQAAVRLYVRWRHESDFGCDLQKKRDIKEDFDAALADLMYWDKKKREGEPDKGCDQRYVPTAAEVEDDAVPTAPSSEVSFAVIGDYGVVSAATEQVADMVKAWNPEFIVSTGDNWYGSSLAFSDLDSKVGQWYHGFIKDYSGIYGDGATRDNFIAALGDHDRDPVGRQAVISDYLNFANFQSQPSTEVRPFYSVVRGPVHIFVVDDGYNQAEEVVNPYGNTATSAQAEWLRVGLLLSTARWKIVVVSVPPYVSRHTSSTNPVFADSDGFKAYTALRWPFKEWGADVLLCGDTHWYERLEVDGFTYIVNGSGGNGRDTENGDPHEGSQIIFDSNWGAQRCTADCHNLQMDFYSLAGALVDSFTMEKA